MHAKFKFGSSGDGGTVSAQHNLWGVSREICFTGELFQHKHIIGNEMDVNLKELKGLLFG